MPTGLKNCCSRRIGNREPGGGSTAHTYTNNLHVHIYGLLSLLPSLSPFFALLPAILIRTDRRIVKELRDAGATTAEKAIPLESKRLRGIRIKRLTNAGSLHPAAGNTYYLDEAGWQALCVKRRQRAALAIVLALIIAAVVFLNRP